jgi:hypothetical protein
MLITSSGLSNGLSILLIFVDCPVKDIVILESLSDKEITEDLADVGIIWLIVETERTSVVQVDGELVGEAKAKNLARSVHLLLHAAAILLLLSSSLYSLPWERATEEIEQIISRDSMSSRWDCSAY